MNSDTNIYFINVKFCLFVFQARQDPLRPAPKTQFLPRPVDSGSGVRDGMARGLVSRRRRSGAPLPVGKKSLVSSFCLGPPTHKAGPSGRSSLRRGAGGVPPVKIFASFPPLCEKPRHGWNGACLARECPKPPGRAWRHPSPAGYGAGRFKFSEAARGPPRVCWPERATENVLEE